MTINSESDYDKALARLAIIFHAEIGAPEGAEAEELTKAIEEYEDKYYPMFRNSEKVDESVAKQASPELGSELEKGEKSGFLENYDFREHLAELKKTSILKSFQ
jgi:hypothetical protein